jgi:tetratricopeptide (TPR) repeat protein
LFSFTSLKRYSEEGQFGDALKNYTSSIEYNPYYVEAYCNIGVIYKNMGKLELAIQYYEKALAVSPNFQIAKSNLAIALTDLGTKVKNEGNLKVGFLVRIHFKNSSNFTFLFSLS